MKLLELIRTTTFSFSTPDSLLMLYIDIVRYKLEYASVVWNSITNTDSTNSSAYKKHLQPFVVIDFFQDVYYHHINILDKLNLQTLHDRQRHIDALSLINVFRGTKSCASVLEAVGLRVPTRTSKTVPRSVVHPATVLQPGVFLLQNQFVNL
jgi:hypothetical protein